MRHIRRPRLAVFDALEDRVVLSHSHAAKVVAAAVTTHTTHKPSHETVHAAASHTQVKAQATTSTKSDTAKTVSAAATSAASAAPAVQAAFNTFRVSYLSALTDPTLAAALTAATNATTQLAADQKGLEATPPTVTIATYFADQTAASNASTAANAAVQTFDKALITDINTLADSIVTALGSTPNAISIVEFQITGQTPQTTSTVPYHVPTPTSTSTSPNTNLGDLYDVLNTFGTSFASDSTVTNPLPVVVAYAISEAETGIGSALLASNNVSL